MPEINPTLTVDGQSYRGWTSMEFTRDIERMSGSFLLSLTDKWPGIANVRPVKQGQACRLTNETDTLISGWIDVAEPQIGTNDHTITITGRDRSGDLIDCTAEHTGGEWINQSLVNIARDLCRPFAISVNAVATTAHETIRKFKLEESETVFSALERLCRIKGLLVTSNPNGDLVLTSGELAIPSTASLKMGVGGNVLSTKGTFNNAERFSHYTVKGQDGGEDFSVAEDASEPIGHASDPGITRYRPLTILAEEAVDIAACERRAQWEATVRAGRARRAIATVQGWYASETLWAPLTLVPCEIPELSLNRQMLITATRGLRDGNGTTMELTLADPSAFTGLAVPETIEEDWGW